MALLQTSPRFPLGYLESYGPRADPVTALTWGLIAISVAVIVIIAVLVVIGTIRRRAGSGGDLVDVPVERGGGGMRWISVGVALTIIALIGSLIWTVQVLAQVNSPVRKPVLTLEVVGRQWWWEVRYDPDDQDRTFATANEIHIPVGQPVMVRLQGADVIHSFWVPALSGKTDAIPGRANVAWLQADQPGIYRGQCTEYCGVQHAHMGFFVVADPPAVFDEWRRGQLQPATPAAEPDARAGAKVFQSRCSACHTIRGTDAGGIVGPDLTHLMSRRTIAAATLPNTSAALGGWIENPDAIKPGVRMPPTRVPPPELQQLLAYLETLR